MSNANVIISINTPDIVNIAQKLISSEQKYVIQSIVNNSNHKAL